MQFDCIVEIPLHSRVKYEINEKGELLYDRILPKGLTFPGNYAFIPNTLAGDNDPLDVLLITEYPIQSTCRVPSRAIGVLFMSDEKGMDEKILAVPVADYSYRDILDINDVPIQTLQEIELFFETYKNLEKNKWTKLNGFENAQSANRLISKYSL